MNTYICIIIYFIIIITSIFIIIIYFKGQLICDLDENKNPSLLPSTLLSQANILKPHASMSLSPIVASNLSPIAANNLSPIAASNLSATSMLSLPTENIPPIEINDNIIIALATSGLFKI